VLGVERGLLERIPGFEADFIARIPISAIEQAGLVSR
jgi:hypothetical protein